MSDYTNTTHKAHMITRTPLVPTTKSPHNLLPHNPPAALASHTRQANTPSLTHFKGYACRTRCLTHHR